MKIFNKITWVLILSIYFDISMHITWAVILLRGQIFSIRGLIFLVGMGLIFSTVTSEINELEWVKGKVKELKTCRIP
jgi:hypothetical protein